MSEFELRKDKLVLYFEEELQEYDNDDENPTDHRCFILYDNYENEYFVAGKRDKEDALDFKFYIKKVEDVVLFLTNIIGSSSSIKLILFNLSNLYENAPLHDYHPYLDFETLDDKSDELGTVVSSFNEEECENIKNKLKVFLKMMKTVRY